jgi:hypothetical protein
MQQNIWHPRKRFNNETRMAALFNGTRRRILNAKLQIGGISYLHPVNKFNLKQCDGITATDN